MKKIIYTEEIIAAIDALPFELQAEVFCLINHYVLNGDLPVNASPVANAMFLALKPVFDKQMRRQMPKSNALPATSAAKPKKTVEPTVEAPVVEEPSELAIKPSKTPEPKPSKKAKHKKLPCPAGMHNQYTAKNLIPKNLHQLRKLTHRKFLNIRPPQRAESPS